MGETVVQNFKLGLDARRSVLTSQAGTLLTLENAHVNQGAELERRKAFIKYASIGNVDSDGNKALFGLEATDTGLVVFTHCFGGGITTNQLTYWGAAAGQPTIVGTVTPGITIYQLMHPALVFGGSQITYNAAYHAMVKATVSQCVNGKAYVIAKFSDQNSFLYYDGQLVLQSVSGKLLSGASTAALLNEFMLRNLMYVLSRQTGWDTSVTVGTLPTSQPNTKSLTLYSPVGTTFTSVPTFASSAGRFVTYDVTGTAATTPWTTTWAPGAGTHTLVVTANSIAYTILNAQVFTTVAAVTAAINEVSSYTRVTATDDSTTVTLSFPWARVNFAGAPAAPTLVIDGGAPTSFTGGTGPGWGDTSLAAFYGTFAPATDTWKLSLVPTPGVTITLGLGNLGALANPTCLMNLRERPFLGNTDRFNFASPADVTGWENQDVGAGFLPFASQWGMSDTLQSLAPYQGMLAVLGQYSIQIWVTSATPANFELKQTLHNVGTVAPLSAQSVGELDVLFLANSGIRSLRVRDSSLNAFVNDIGSPIDGFLQPVLSSLTAVQKAAACSIVNPEDGRYWLFLYDTVYVLTYFPTIKIIAWSTYKPTYVSDFRFTISGSSGNCTFGIPLSNGTIATFGVAFNTDLATTAFGIKTWINTHYMGDWTATSSSNVVILTPVTKHNFPLPDFSATTTAGNFAGVVSFTESSFAPTKFVVYQGQIYATDDTAIYYYGGPTKNDYDCSVATVETPWLDGREKNVTKQFAHVNAAVAGKWAISAGSDPYSNTLEAIATIGDPAAQDVQKDSTFDKNNVSFTSRGTHFKMKAVSDRYNVGRSTVSALIMLDVD